MTLTLLSIFALDILLRNVNPVAHAALHDALDQEELLFRAPVSVEELEVQIVQDDILANCLSCGGDPSLSSTDSRYSYTCTMALEANDQRLAGTTDSFVLNRADLDALADVVIAQATKLWADDIFEVGHFSFVKVRGVVINFLTSRI
jgi:hypothetical protein